MKLSTRFFAVHPFHLVDISPWPILISFNLLAGALALVNWLTFGQGGWGIFGAAASVALVMFFWLRDIIREGQSGFHTIPVRTGIILGFVIFLITEILLFFSFFWAYFHISLNPSVELAIWPPLGINFVDYKGLPFLNCTLLVGAGFTLTWGHHSYIKGEKDTTLLAMFISVIIIFIFLCVQAIEFSYGEFTIADSAFGSLFYSMTGLHGAHVLLALIKTVVTSYRIYIDQSTNSHSLGLDASLMYYHLVDIIFLILYASLYYWGG